jgi:hypothetical protein
MFAEPGVGSITTALTTKTMIETVGEFLAAA